jgi:hypothetical protein
VVAELRAVGQDAQRLADPALDDPELGAAAHLRPEALQMAEQVLARRPGKMSPEPGEPARRAWRRPVPE